MRAGIGLSVRCRLRRLRHSGRGSLGASVVGMLGVLDHLGGWEWCRRRYREFANTSA